MSINKRGNIAVSCNDLDTIFEYTPTGNCVRKITVDAINKTIRGLRHAIQLDDDRFLICHANAKTHNRVCIIDSNGKMLRSYGGRTGSEMGQMNYPCYLAFNGQEGFIFVADRNNNRIIQLDLALEFVKEIIPGSEGLKQPKRMHLHEKSNRLYTAEYFKSDFKIFDL